MRQIRLILTAQLRRVTLLTHIIGSLRQNHSGMGFMLLANDAGCVLPVLVATNQ